VLIRHRLTIEGTPLDVSDQQWRSVRLLVAEDGFGYSLHETTVAAGSSHVFHYKNHVETVYIVEGRGHLVDHATGATHELDDGRLYVLNNADKHTLYAKTTLRAVCVFTPPCIGSEVHAADGSYPATTP
jgi:L-ectoine synthase